MGRKKTRYSEILSALVFIPPAKNKIVNIIHSLLKKLFRLSGKIISTFLYTKMLL